jgi:hypothetical protein
VAKRAAPKPEIESLGTLHVERRGLLELERLEATFLHEPVDQANELVVALVAPSHAFSEV